MGNGTEKIMEIRKKVNINTESLQQDRFRRRMKYKINITLNRKTLNVILIVIKCETFTIYFI